MEKENPLKTFHFWYAFVIGMAIGIAIATLSLTL